MIRYRRQLQSSLSSLALIGALTWGGLHACTSTRAYHVDEENTQWDDDELYGDLDDGIDTAEWLDEGYDSKSPIDRALSQSPYRDFEPLETTNEDTFQHQIRTKKASQRKKTLQGTKGSDEWWRQ